MTAFPQSAWALLSKPMLAANSALIMASAVAFHWVLPRLPAQIALRVDVHGQPAGPGNPEELWVMGAIMAISLGLPLLAAVAAGAGALDPTRRLEYRLLLFAHRKNTVRLVEGLVLGANLTIGSSWLGLALGQLPDYPRALPLQAMLPLSLVIMAVAILVPFALLLPAHLQLTHALQTAIRHDRDPERETMPARLSGGAGGLRVTEGEIATVQADGRAQLVLALLLLPSLVLMLSVWLGP